MDSMTQAVLGAAVTVAVMRRRTAVWKSALWGAVAGTLPDLDVLIDHGDPILNMVLHRAETHALFWLTLFSLPLAWLVARLHGDAPIWRRWWLALWLALVTHPLLDTLTVYGTQLALPFSNHPYGVGSVFIIDPLVTLPWLVGVLWAVAARGSRMGLRANRVGLAIGVAYLASGVVMQALVENRARDSLRAQGIVPEQLLVTPSPFNTVLWRVVAVDQQHVHEGFYSWFDAPGPIRFDRFDRGLPLLAELKGHDGTKRIRAFSKGLYKLHEQSGKVVISDLRMGQEPGYVFAFAVAQRASPLQLLPVSQDMGGRGDARAGLAWVWQRMWGAQITPPR